MKCLLTTSDIINIILTVAALSVSVVAVVISYKTLRQNTKMIEETTRPQVQIYPVFLDGILYIIIKNYGASEAYIDELTCSHFFTSAETMSDKLEGDIFSKAKGAILSSGYSIKCPLLGYNIRSEIFDFHIRYHSSTKTYAANFSFNPVASAPFADMSPTSDTIKGHCLNISKQLNNIVKTKL